MLKREINRIKRIKKEMGWVKNFFDVDSALFLFGFKPSVLIFPRAKNYKEFDFFLNLCICFSQICTRKKIYAYKFLDRLIQDCSFIISYNELKYKEFITKGKFNHLNLGKVLGYPKCCIRKFVEEYKEDGKGYICFDSAKRYLKQLEEMKIKEDLFGLKVSKNGVVMESTIAGFIPCSPKCKKAIKLIENYKSINKILNKNGI